jgi:hypothetical protein
VIQVIKVEPYALPAAHRSLLELSRLLNDPFTKLEYRYPAPIITPSFMLAALGAAFSCLLCVGLAYLVARTRGWGGRSSPRAGGYPRFSKLPSI